MLLCRQENIISNKHFIVHVEVHSFQTQSQNYVRVGFILRLPGKEALVHTDWFWTWQHHKKKIFSHLSGIDPRDKPVTSYFTELHRIPDLAYAV